MNLPNAHLAMAEQEKICGYLLNPAHPDNGGKAQFFMALGFRVENWRAWQPHCGSWREVRR